MKVSANREKMAVVRYYGSLFLSNDSSKMTREVVVHDNTIHDAIMPNSISSNMLCNNETDWQRVLDKAMNIGMCVEQDDVISQDYIQLGDNVHMIEYDYSLSTLIRHVRIIKTNCPIEYNDNYCRNTILVNHNNLSLWPFRITTDFQTPKLLIKRGEDIKLANKNLTLTNSGDLTVRAETRFSVYKRSGVLHAHFKNGCLVAIVGGGIVVRIEQDIAEHMGLTDDERYGIRGDGNLWLSVPNVNDRLVHVVCSLCYTKSRYITACVTQDGRLVLVRDDGDCDTVYSDGVVKEIGHHGHSLETVNTWATRLGVSNKWCLVISMVVVDCYDSTYVDIELVVKRDEWVVTKISTISNVVSSSLLVGVVYPNLSIKSAASST